jgi:solute carrier family 25 (mitochondrial citrate transporter), member 1
MPPSPSKEQPSKSNSKKNPLLHLVAGGAAGLVESSVCHPLDTIKTRMQLRRQNNTMETAVKKMRDSLMEPALRFRHSLQEPVLKTSSAAATTLEPSLVGGTARAASTTTMASAPPPRHTVIIKPTSNIVQAPLGPIGTATRIIKREGFLALYKGLSAVYMGIIPKMAIRFVSFEQYREIGTSMNGGKLTTSITFTAGLLSGLTEAVLVVTPAEVCKIRMQSQYNSLIDPAQLQHRKYTNVFQTAFTIVREEGVGALYSGVVPTMLRQGCNQAVNFTAYNMIKTRLMEYQGTSELASWQSLLIGGLSGGMGPLVNNPLDVVKTRLQKQVVVPGKTPKYTGLVQACVTIARDEGVLSLWKGITPRLLRIMPGQAITFMTYEAVSSQLVRFQAFA